MPKITVREFKSADRPQWETFVNTSNNGTMFQKLAFLDYHPENKFAFRHLMFFENEHLVGVLPGGYYNTESGEYWSPVGASYGSIVTQDISFEKSLAIVDAFMEYCRGQRFKEVFLIPPPLIYCQNYSQHIEYAMLYRKFDFELHYISHAIHLKHGADFLQHFDPTARKTIRKVLRDGVLKIEDSDDYATFHDILLKNKARHNVKPTHSLEDLLKLRELMPENLKLFMVYHEGKAIAGSLLFLCNSKVALCFYNMMLFEYEHLKPMYLIMHETVRWATEAGYEWVDIGVSQVPSDPDPMTPSLNLINFKERFDSRGILRSTYHFTFG
ncbi:MAG: GNAT family N-acetyltransferase [Bacteroidota bacterium]